MGLALAIQPRPIRNIVCIKWKYISFFARTPRDKTLISAKVFETRASLLYRNFINADFKFLLRIFFKSRADITGRMYRGGNYQIKIEEDTSRRKFLVRDGRKGIKKKKKKRLCVSVDGTGIAIPVREAIHFGSN